MFPFDKLQDLTKTWFSRRNYLPLTSTSGSLESTTVSMLSCSMTVLHIWKYSLAFSWWSNTVINTSGSWKQGLEMEIWFYDKATLSVVAVQLLENIFSLQWRHEGNWCVIKKRRKEGSSLGRVIRAFHYVVLYLNERAKVFGGPVLFLWDELPLQLGQRDELFSQLWAQRRKGTWVQFLRLPLVQGSVNHLQNGDDLEQCLA